MYRRPKFLEILHEIREEMSREADYDMDLFAEMARSGKSGAGKRTFEMGAGAAGGVENDELDVRDLTADYGHPFAADN